MSTVSEHICDRCKKPIEYARFPWSVVRTCKQVKLLGFGAYDYMDSRDELCHDCTKKYDAFMRGDDFEPKEAR